MYIQNAKMGNPELFPGLPIFLLVEHPPIPLEHWKPPMAAPFCETLLYVATCAVLLSL